MENIEDFEGFGYLKAPEPPTSQANLPWLVTLMLVAALVVLIYFHMNNKMEKLQEHQTVFVNSVKEIAKNVKQLQESSHTIRDRSRPATRSASPATPLSNPYVTELERGQTPSRKVLHVKSYTPERNNSTQDTKTGANMDRTEEEQRQFLMRRSGQFSNRVSPFGTEGASGELTPPVVQPRDSTHVWNALPVQRYTFRG